MLAVARGAAVGGHQPVEGPVPAAEPRQPDPHHHLRSPLAFPFAELLVRRESTGGGSGTPNAKVLAFGRGGHGSGYWIVEEEMGRGIGEVDEGTKPMGRRVLWARPMFIYVL